MTNKIKSVQTKENLIISVVFFNGTTKEYDVKNLFNIYPQLQDLKDQNLFKSVQVDSGGYGISWNDNLDLDAETIWEDGISVKRENTDIVFKLASLLTNARNKVGVTQKQLAEKTGIYQADISKIERGLSNPSIGTLQRLADGMGLQIEINFKKTDPSLDDYC